MDDRRFDDFTRRLASGSTRRHVLKTLTGGVLGGVAGAIGFGRAAAATCATDTQCARGERCDLATGMCIRRGGSNRPEQPHQTQAVGIAAACTTAADCAANETCVDSMCTPRGGSGQCVRGAACIADATCCGGEVCDTLNGVCVGAGGPCTNPDGTCLDSTDCCGNEDCVAGVCQQTAGGCAPGATCAGDAECCGGQVCVNGSCARAARQAGCVAGQVRCNGVCVDIQSDPNNCGACGAGCAHGQPCIDRICLASSACTRIYDCDLLGFGHCAKCDNGTCRTCNANERCNHQDVDDRCIPL